MVVRIIKTELKAEDTTYCGTRFSEATNLKYGIAEDQSLDIYSQGGTGLGYDKWLIAW